MLLYVHTWLCLVVKSIFMRSSFNDKSSLPFPPSPSMDRPGRTLQSCLLQLKNN